MEAGATKKSSARGKGPTTIARAYFEALADHDLDRAVELWEPGCVDHLVGLADLRAPDEFRAWFGRLFAAFPDFRMEVVSLAASKEHAAVRWRGTGTFDGTARFEGMEPNGASVDVEGCDMLTIRDGRIVDNHAYMNAADLARQLGAMPPKGSVAERGLIGAFNAKTAAVKGIQRLRERQSARG
jgi:steroid delta-isomerase-like uncharacterized protein